MFDFTIKTKEKRKMGARTTNKMIFSFFFLFLLFRSSLLFVVRVDAFKTKCLYEDLANTLKLSVEKSGPPNELKAVESASCTGEDCPDEVRTKLSIREGSLDTLTQLPLTKIVDKRLGQDLKMCFTNLTNAPLYLKVKLTLILLSKGIEEGAAETESFKKLQNLLDVLAKNTDEIVGKAEVWINKEDESLYKSDLIASKLSLFSIFLILVLIYIKYILGNKGIDILRKIIK